MSQKAIALVIGLIMLGSTIGFAFMQTTPEDQQQGPTIPIIVNRALLDNEKLQILRAGRVLIEYFYTGNSSNHFEEKQTLEIFTNRLSGYVVLEEVLTDKDELSMIGSAGDIIPLNATGITDGKLLRTFCEITFARPRECLLLEF